METSATWCYGTDKNPVGTDRFSSFNRSCRFTKTSLSNTWLVFTLMHLTTIVLESWVLPGLSLVLFESPIGEYLHVLWAYVILDSRY